MGKILSFVSLLLAFSSHGYGIELLWPAGENVCSGGWQYEETKSCSVCKLRQNLPNPACGQDVRFVEHSSCKVLEYQACQSQLCTSETRRKASTPDQNANNVWAKSPNYGCKAGETLKSRVYIGSEDIQVLVPGGPIVGGAHKVTVKLHNWSVTCQSRGGVCKASNCPVVRREKCRRVTTDKTCRHSSNPCERFEVVQNAQCGTDAKISKPGLHKDAVSSNFNKISDHLNIGSSCVTCDDLPVENPETIKVKFNCLRNTIENGLSGGGVSFSAGFKAIQLMKELGYEFSSDLTEEQNAYLIKIIEQFP